jgi:hypothetical protein
VHARRLSPDQKRVDLPDDTKGPKEQNMETVLFLLSPSDTADGELEDL